MSSYGSLLKSLREARGVSQNQLERSSGYDHSFISRLESGARNPTRTAVIEIAQALDCTREETDWLLNAAGFAPVSLRSVLNAPILADLDDIFAALPEGNARLELESLVSLAIYRGREALAA